MSERLAEAFALVAVFVLPIVLAEAAPPELPEAEKALADTVDPWGLAFSDQLVRFQRHFADRPDARFALGVTHGLVKVLPVKYWYTDSAVPSSPPAGVRPTDFPERWAAAGATESFQVVVLPRMGAPEAAYTVSVALDGLPGAQARVYREVFVQTAEPAYPRLASDRWPDPLIPESRATASGLDCAVFWVDVDLPPGPGAGRLTATVTVSDGEEQAVARVPIRVVGGLALDAKTYPLVAWFPRAKLSEEAYRGMCALALAHHLQPVDALKGAWDPDHPERFDELRAFLAAHGQRLFQVDTPGAKAFDSLYAHLKEKGWLSSTIAYSNEDEPSGETFREKNAPFMREVREKYPGLRIFLASDRHPNMEDGCDIWLTDLSASGYDPDRDRDQKRPELWHYYCHLPVRWQMRAPLVMAPNMQIDNPALEHRVALWMSHYYGARGVFIWAGAYFTFGEDFWQTLRLSDKPSGFPYAGIHNGNGFLVYPAPQGEGFIPSLRLKVLRDGMEDLALFAAARERAKAEGLTRAQRRQIESLIDPAPEVFVRPHHFDRLPETLLTRREALLRELASVSGAP